MGFLQTLQIFFLFNQSNISRILGCLQKVGKKRQKIWANKRCSHMFQSNISRILTCLQKVGKKRQKIWANKRRGNKF